MDNSLIQQRRIERRHIIPASNPNDPRPPGRRDRDRILYSSALRRLSGITQVVAPTERHLIHNRLTHSLEVAQIGRSIAENLLSESKNHALAVHRGGLDPDVVEAACLAHDLGHPPFGHVAEHALNALAAGELGHSPPDTIVDGFNGFEGNAQTFRILTRLSVRYPNVRGLNLTRATLRAVLKYPWMREETEQRSEKWGAYRSEQDDFDWATQLTDGEGLGKSLEAQIMDWADDVAYAVHDLEDFYRAGLIPLERLVNNTDERSMFCEREATRISAKKGLDKASLAAAFDEIIVFAPFDNSYQGGRAERAKLRNFTSTMVDRYVQSVSLSESNDGIGSLVIERESELEVAMLKGLTWQYVIESRPLSNQRFGERHIITSLFQIFLAAVGTQNNRDDWGIFPEYYREMLEEFGSGLTTEAAVRIVIDLISSLTEAQALETYLRLTGISRGSIMDPAIP